MVCIQVSGSLLSQPSKHTWEMCERTPTPKKNPSYFKVPSLKLTATPEWSVFIAQLKKQAQQKKRMATLTRTRQRLKWCEVSLRSPLEFPWLLRPEFAKHRMMFGSLVPTFSWGWQETTEKVLQIFFAGVATASFLDMK